MGVSASGKTSVGRELARVLGVEFVDADGLHPETNIAKMSAGIPLTDQDRWSWLDVVGQALGSSSGVVISCSALKRIYRDRLRLDNDGVVFVHLTGSPALLTERALSRTGHFMPPTLLQSQLATLEPLEADEEGFEVNIDAPVVVIVQRALEWMHARER